jgi:hypothetical protein
MKQPRQEQVITTGPQEKKVVSADQTPPAIKDRSKPNRAGRGQKILDLLFNAVFIHSPNGRNKKGATGRSRVITDQPKRSVICRHFWCPIVTDKFCTLL